MHFRKSKAHDLGTHANFLNLMHTMGLIKTGLHITATEQSEVP